MFLLFALFPSGLAARSVGLKKEFGNLSRSSAAAATIASEQVLRSSGDEARWWEGLVGNEPNIKFSLL